MQNLHYRVIILQLQVIMSHLITCGVPFIRILLMENAMRKCIVMYLFYFSYLILQISKVKDVSSYIQSICVPYYDLVLLVS